jgi:hypothetical protein
MLTHNQPMARHCSFRVGGIAQDFFIPDTLNALSDFLKNNQQPILMLGLGHRKKHQINLVFLNNDAAGKLPLSFYFCACFLNFQKLPKFHLDGVHNQNTKEALKVLPNIIESGDVVLTLGAGDIHTLVKPIITQYANS